MNDKSLSRRTFLKFAGIAGINLLNSSFFSKIPMFLENNAPTETIPSFIILLFDTLSARHMNLHGYERNTTPNITKFAEQSTVFHHHYAAGNFTIPNTASLFTGVYPWSHRAFHLFGQISERYLDRNLFAKIQKAQISSIAYTHNTQTSYLLHQYASKIQDLYPIETLVNYDSNKIAYAFKNDYPRGFDAVRRWKDEKNDPANSLFLRPFMTFLNLYNEAQIQSQYKSTYPLGVSASLDGYSFLLENTIDWISQILDTNKKPYLAYFHLLPPHEPYRPRKDYFDLFADDHLSLPEKPPHFFSEQISPNKLAFQRQRYDEYLAFTDAEFGRLLKNLKQTNILDSTYLIVTSDHGQLFERGIHGHINPTLYEPLVHIPLIIHAPGQTQRKDVYSPTSIVDIMPTLIHLSGGKNPDWCEGKILPKFGGEEDTDRIVFAVEAKENSSFTSIRKATLSAVHWPFKLINYQGYPGYDGVFELFNLENDPEEINNISESKPEIVSNLRQLLLDSLASAEQNSIGNQ